MNRQASSSIPASGRHQRKMRNLLLDKKFQLKYTGYLMVIATGLGLSLGVILWRTSAQVIAQSAQSAEQGEQIVQLGKEVVAESKKVSAVVRMNIVKDPVYQDEPDLLAAFTTEAKEQDRKIDAQSERLAKQHDALVEHAMALKNSQQTMMWSLAGALILLIAGIGMAGIVVTHKVAGPIYKMRRHLRDVAKGKLEVPWGLRKGDELVDFFETFRQMVASLRSERESQISELRSALEQLEPGNDEARAVISGVIAELEHSLK